MQSFLYNKLCQTVLCNDNIHYGMLHCLTTRHNTMLFSQDVENGDKKAEDQTWTMLNGEDTTTDGPQAGPPAPAPTARDPMYPPAGMYELITCFFYRKLLILRILSIKKESQN